MNSGAWITRLSGRGVPYQVVAPPMPWVDPEFLDAVVYLYPSEAEAQDGKRIGGSGFVVGYPLKPTKKALLCVVTNKHVIDSGNMVVRVNTTDGKTDTIALDHAKWYLHPQGDDIAICPISLSSLHRVKHLRSDAFITKETIDGFDIGPGDECFIVGRFVNHEGRQRNLPSVRFGNISQMPWEPIVIDGFPQESFLVEARSISGYSGSPVYVYVPSQMHSPQIVKAARDHNFKLPGVSPKRVNLPMMAGPWLLGVDFCHIRWDEPIWSRITNKPVSDDWFIKSNTGMMGVVPAWKIMEILEGPEMKPLIEQTTKQVVQSEQDNSSVELDAASLSKSAPPAKDENPQHREGFTSLLNAAARKQTQGD